MSNSVALCMIVKNEEKNIASLLEAVCPVLEQVVIVDTGSTDRTLSILEECKAKYASLVVEHFVWVDDFAAARNHAFGFAQQDWIMFLDGDDIVDQNDLRKFKNTVLGKDPSIECWILDYIYSQFPDGSPRSVLGRERFVKRTKNPKWVGAIHEVIDISSMKQASYKELKVIHRRDGKNIELGRNLRILAKEYTKNPNDPRTAYYYGKELFDHVDPKGIEVLEAYVKLPYKYYDDHVNALFRLGCHYLSVKQHRKALDAAYEIYHVDHSRQRAECYWIFGSVEQDICNWKPAIESYERCLRCVAESPRVINLEHYTWHPHKRLIECYNAIGDVEKAFYHLGKLHDMLKHDAGMMKWISGYLDRTLLPSRKLAVGVCIDSITMINKNVLRAIPDGFLKTLYVDEYQESYMDKLAPRGSMYVYKSASSILPADKQGITRHVKADKDLPTLAFVEGDERFGPYRIRLKNLARSAAINGYPIVSVGTKADYTFFRCIQEKPHAHMGTIVLDICEMIDKGYYDRLGVEHADIVTAASDVLAEDLMRLYPNKTVRVLDDHYELPKREWLGPDYAGVN